MQPVCHLTATASTRQPPFNPREIRRSATSSTWPRATSPPPWVQVGTATMAESFNSLFEPFYRLAPWRKWIESECPICWVPCLKSSVWKGIGRRS
jgi:hypothetical protein